MNRRAPAAGAAADTVWLAVAALLCLALGSLHAFSVLIPNLEREVIDDRAAISAIYSAATFLLMAGVLLTPPLWQRLGHWLLALAGLGAGLALWVFEPTGYAVAFATLGVGFGVFNGIGYAASLKAATGALPGRQGLAVGIVTAAYSGSAIVFASLLRLPGDDLAGQVRLIALACAAAGAIALLTAAVRPPATPADSARRAPSSPRIVADGLVRGRALRLWAIYGAGVTAGLMVLAHAAAVMRWTGAGESGMTAGVMLVSAGSLCGSLLAGAASVRMSSHLVLMVALLATAAAVAALAASPPPAAALALVAVCGLAYGALITAIPNLVDESFPAAIAFRLFSLVFTAWGVGGIAGPVAAGAAFERFGSYAPGLAAAAVLALGGAWLLRRI